MLMYPSDFVRVLLVTKIVHKMSSDCFFNANSAIVQLFHGESSAILQLYHGENKIIVNEMMMRSTLY